MLTSYNFLASLQIIFNLEHGQLKFLDNFLLLSTIYSRQERVNIILSVKVLVGATEGVGASSGYFVHRLKSMSQMDSAADYLTCV